MNREDAKYTTGNLLATSQIFRRKVFLKRLVSPCSLANQVYTFCYLRLKAFLGDLSVLPSGGRFIF
jgi:hypothetical protein